jgi:hypothetical protein
MKTRAYRAFVADFKATVNSEFAKMITDAIAEKS